MNLTTKLEAVNVMLSTIGEAAVNSLSSGLLDAETAETILDNVTRSVQTTGWSFNEEVDYTLSPDSDGILNLPANCVRVDLAKSESKYRNANYDYVQRGTKLYDKINHTYAINETVKVDMIITLDFNELPEAARRFISIRASRIFQERVVGSETLSRFSDDDENTAWLDLLHTESDVNDYNIFDDSSTYRVLNRSINSKVF
jgi:hypothetical protein